MKSTIYLLSILSISILMIQCSPRPAFTLKHYVRSHNSGNVEETLKYYDENIEFTLQNVWTKKGKMQMRELEEWDASLNSHLEVRSIKVKGDTVISQIVESNDWFRAIGMDQLVHDPVRFTIRRGQIQKIEAVPNPADGERIGAAIGQLFEWSMSNGDDTIHSLIRNGEFVYSREAARSWMELFDRWKNDTSDEKEKP